MSTTRPVTDAELDAAIAALRSDGFAVLPGLATPATLTRLRARLDALLSGALPDPGLFVQEEGTTGRYEDVAKVPGALNAGRPLRKIEKLERDEQFAAWIADPVFARVCARVLPGAVNLYRAVLFQKVARIGSDTPWHQDGGRLWGLSAEPELQIWTALDDAPATGGALEVVPGSHHAGLVTPLGGVIPAERCQDLTTRLLPARAGDVVLLHNHLWHRTGPNITDSVRRALTACYLPASTRCVRRKKAPRDFPRVFGPELG